MLFNSLDFAIFLPIVFILYWFITQKNLKLQNALIVVSSYVFYGWWDWRFLSLILFSTVVDYLIGQRLRTEDKQFKRKILLWISITVNLGFLGFFGLYYFIYKKYIAGKKNSDNNMLFYSFLILWAFYGVFYTMDPVLRNVGYNVLDLFSKCFVGIFFWAYFTGVFKI